MRIKERLPEHMPPLRYNLVADTDSYKFSHFLIYRTGTTSVYSYIESRGGHYPAIMFAGLQPLLYAKLGQRVTEEDLAELRRDLPKHGVPFNEAGWRKIIDVYDGWLPLRIKAVAEGTLVPVRNVLFTVENLDPDLYWLTSYFETMILRDLWTACSIATRNFYIAQRINASWVDRSDNPMSPFAFLDFSSRGVMGYDHSCLAGIGHLFHFMGSDNYPAIRHVNYYYHHEMAGYSVIASEHSISCGFGRDNDADYIDNAIERVPEGSILSLVGDTWNIFEFSKTLVTRKEAIINKNITMVCRPDSGEIFDVNPEVLRILAGGFGTDRNSKGRDVIRYGVKVLTGDGMNEKTHMQPFEVAESLAIAPDSVMTAAGGGMATADMDRDKNRWAMKASNHVIDGVETPIMKDPITDPGKASKAGRFALIYNPETGYQSVNIVAGEVRPDDLLVERFNTGRVVNAHYLDDIRALVASQF
ncbi:nicotinamide phosphoribosyl transferase [Caulobacter phage CcrSC]|uniref:Nicotinamide phosphoribosyltransferase n=3 Tax=Caulobacter phage CcrSC TaxID=2283272 RepID=A0A8F5FBV4_9CAUD|nr:nicotinamide phosphoribosyl transferase [Caulobacter phage CcrSC]QXL90279.1 nicotinamide phosphoribosyltransferase [Caulobacter phage CcrSC]